jgi:uncharacterized repeat protein (TIGR04138 family)
MSEKHARSMEQLIRDDGRYPPEAYAFLHEGLSRASRKVHGGSTPPGEKRHVTAEQHCMELKDLAVERWGMLARTVLAKWNVTGTVDFGNMVYMLAEAGHIKTSPTDSHDDYRDVFDFDEAFGGEGSFEMKE